MHGEDEGKKPFERPRHGWDDIETDLQWTICKGVKWI